MRPAAPPTCSPASVHRVIQGSASVRRPVRFRWYPFRAPPRVVTSYPCLVVCSYLLYTYTYSLLHLSVSALCVLSALKGRVPVCDPAQPSVLCLNRFSVQSVISPSPFSLSLAWLQFLILVFYSYHNMQGIYYIHVHAFSLEQKCYKSALDLHYLYTDPCSFVCFGRFMSLHSIHIHIIIHIHIYICIPSIWRELNLLFLRVCVLIHTY